ncbi:MAG: hypothetical protein ACK6D5_16280 [Planctomyces sp.]
MRETPEELTAWHEAGHAWAALVVGAKVHSVSIAPDDDDGPRRFGDTVIHWSRRRFAGKRLAVELCRVALAGPVAEMLYSGRPFHPGTVSEWSQDWLAALEAMNFIPERQRRMALLEQTTIDLYERFSDDFHWQAISAIAEPLLAHEILDEELLQDAIGPWEDGVNSQF